jgi:hypothetical protein
MRAEEVGDPECVHDKEIVILEYSQHTHIGRNAHQQPHFSSRALRPVYQDAGEIVNDNGEDEDDYVNRNKEHVEHTTGDKQMQPPPFVWQQKIENSDYRKENEKSEGIKNHASPLALSVNGGISKWLLPRFPGVIC